MHVGDIYTGAFYNSSYGRNSLYQYVYARHSSGLLHPGMWLRFCSAGTALRVMFCNGTPPEIPIEICKQGYRNTAKLPLEELKLPVEQHFHELITPQDVPYFKPDAFQFFPQCIRIIFFPVFPWYALFIFSSVNSRILSSMAEICLSFVSQREAYMKYHAESKRFASFEESEPPISSDSKSISSILRALARRDLSIPVPFCARNLKHASKNGEKGRGRHDSSHFMTVQGKKTFHPH